MRFLEQVDAVEKDLHDKIVLPTLDEGQDAKDDMLEAERAEKILAHFRRFEYASNIHVLLSPLWETSMRLGAVHSLDVGDFGPEEQSLKIRHRPEQGTYLKNKQRGEWIVALQEETCEVENIEVETLSGTIAELVLESLRFNGRDVRALFEEHDDPFDMDLIEPISSDDVDQLLTHKEEQRFLQREARAQRWTAHIGKEEAGNEFRIVPLN